MPRKPWTDEMRKAAGDRLRAAREAKAAVVDVQPPDRDAPVAVGVVDDPLADLIAGLQKVQTKKKTSDADLEQLGQILDRLDPQEHPEIADNPAIEAFLDRLGTMRQKRAEQQGLPPGAVIGEGLGARDVQWKLADVNRKPDGSKELVTWTPAETVPVFYNGVMCQCIADVEMTTEKAFYDVYAEHRRLVREAEVRKQWMFGRTSQRPPEEGEAAVSMSRVRAFLGMGGEGGGGRILVGYPGDAKFELRDVPGSGAEGNAETPTV